MFTPNLLRCLHFRLLPLQKENRA